VAKKLTASVVFLVILITLAYFVGKKARPTVIQSPMLTLQSSEISHITLMDSGTPVVLEKIDNSWWLVAPVRDEADDAQIEPLLSALTAAKIGSVVSQNPAHFKDYGVEPGHSVRLQVRTSSAAAPVVDVYIGKTASNFLDSYVRFEGGNDVRVAGGFPTDFARPNSDTFRLRRLLKPGLNEAVSISVRVGKSIYELERSSDIWKNAKSGAIVPSVWIDRLKAKIAALTIVSFVVLSDETAGFTQPALTLTVRWPQSEQTIVIGKMELLPSAGYHARINNRRPASIISIEPTKELLDYLKAAPPKS
jgi:hypothetical protein